MDPKAVTDSFSTQAKWALKNSVRTQEYLKSSLTSHKSIYWLCLNNPDTVPCPWMRYRMWASTARRVFIGWSERIASLSRQMNASTGRYQGKQKSSDSPATHFLPPRWMDDRSWFYDSQTGHPCCVPFDTHDHLTVGPSTWRVQKYVHRSPNKHRRWHGCHREVCRQKAYSMN